MFGGERARGGGRVEGVPAAVALPVSILTCVSSSEMRLCASSAMAGLALEMDAPHWWHA